MRRLVCLTLVLGAAACAAGPTLLAEETPSPAVASEESAAPAAAPEERTAPPAFSTRKLVVGVQGVETDTRSSRFLEYRDVPRGVYLPYARFAGSDGKLVYDVLARNVLQQDAAYRLRLEPRSFGLTVEYVKIPHRFGNDGHTLLNEVSAGNFVISDSLQQAYQNALAAQFAANRNLINYDFLRRLVTPSLESGRGIDLALLREQGRAELRLTKDKPVDVRVTYFHEKRRGDRAVGTSFGFGNVVESPEPIEYRTQDIGATAEYGADWGRVNAVFNYNWFTNNIPFHTWDNPFRATSSTDPSAYTGPGSGSINGPAFGRASLPPNNKAVTGGVGGTLKLAKRARLGANVVLGQWTQDETAFIPYTTNSAISTPALPAGKLDGKIDTLSFSSFLTANPGTGFSLSARYRRYDLDNKTPQLRFPGYVRYDAVFEDIPRISVPYSYANDRFDATASYSVDELTFEAGYRWDRMHRHERETETATYGAFLGRADWRASDWLVLRGTVEVGSRDYDGLNIILSEEASFQQPGDPANLLAVPASSPIYASLGCGGKPCNLRYDQAAKDVTRYGAHLVLTPGGSATLTATYLYGEDDYKETRFGLLRAKNRSFGLDLDYTPTERVNLFGYYNYEKLSDFQRGRQSGATVSNDPRADWTSDVQDKVNTVGGGARFALVKDKLDLGLNGSYQKLDGNNALFSPPGGTPDIAVSIPNYDDTELWTLGGELSYRFTKELKFGLGGWLEDYTIRDAQTTGLFNYLPGSLFLNPVDSDYQAHVFYVKATYVW